MVGLRNVTTSISRSISNSNNNKVPMLLSWRSAPRTTTLRWIVTLAVASLVVLPFFMSAFYLKTNEETKQDKLMLGLPINDKGFSTNIRPSSSTTARANMTKPQLRLDIPRLKRQAKFKSSVDYMACCGLGHRMSKVVDAHYIAYKKELGLRIFFGFCQQTEIFHYFFGPQPLEELANVKSRQWSFKINNEAPCFKRFARTRNVSSNCSCPKDYMEQAGIFYKGLMNRFRQRQELQLFMEQHQFANHTVIGLHVRVGNGETGDFEKKNRRIFNMNQWIHSITNNILIEMSQKWIEQPPLLFIATDTASIVDEFRSQLQGYMTVIDYPQERAANGSGVLFGAAGTHQERNDECLLHWKNAFMDMMLLASTDVVVASRPSSFTQSLPMSVVLARNSQERKTYKVYCEVSPNATMYQCYEDFDDWCCHGMTQFHLQGIRGYEYRRIPAVDFDDGCSMDHHWHRRPPRESDQLVSYRNQQVRTAFLPYDWDHVERDHGTLQEFYPK